MRLILMLTFALSLTAFQNCGAPTKFQSVATASLASNGNGTGYDGKLYNHYGVCGNKQDIQQAIQVTSSDGAFLVKDACRTLNPATRIAASELTFVGDVLLFRGQVFDVQQPVNQPQFITFVFCTSLDPGKTSSFKVYAKANEYKNLGDAVKFAIATMGETQTRSIGNLNRTATSSRLGYSGSTDSQSLSAGISFVDGDAKVTANFGGPPGSLFLNDVPMTCALQLEAPGP